MDITILIPIVTGLVSAIKTAGLPSKYAPAVSLVLGIAAAYLINDTIVSGLVIGLSASGLYSGVKATVK